MLSPLFYKFLNKLTLQWVEKDAHKKGRKVRVLLGWIQFTRINHYAEKKLIFFPLKVPENIISVKRRNESSLKEQQLKVQKAKTKHPWALLLISWLLPDSFDTNRRQKLRNKHKQMKWIFARRNKWCSPLPHLLRTFQVLQNQIKQTNKQQIYIMLYHFTAKVLSLYC